MKKTLILIEDNFLHFERIKEALNKHFSDAYHIVSYNEIDKLVSELSNFVIKKDINGLRLKFKEWCNNKIKDNEILAFIIDINLFNSFELTGLTLKNLIKNKQIFITNEDMSINLPIFIISGIDDQDVIDSIDDQNIVDEFISKDGSSIEKRLGNAIQKAIENYQKIITPNVIVQNYGTYVEKNFSEINIDNE